MTIKINTPPNPPMIAAIFHPPVPDEFPVPLKGAGVAVLLGFGDDDGTGVRDGGVGVLVGGAGV